MLVSRGRLARNPYAVEWAINYWYLQGVREFTILSWKTGRVRMTFESPDGALHLRYEDVLAQYQRMLGLLMRTDIRPRVKPRRRMSLDGMRKAAVGQIVLDEIAESTNPERTKLALLEGLLQFGTMGLAAWSDRELTMARGSLIETIPPWQLIPVPAKPTRAAEAIGIIRHRWVPYEQFRDTHPELRYPNKVGGELDPRLQPRYLPVGEKATDQDDADDSAGIPVTDPFDRGLGSYEARKHPSDIPYVEVAEYWQPDRGNAVDQYVVTLGRYLSHNATFNTFSAETKPQMPIAIARSMHSGGFYGRPWLSMLVPLNNECERMLEALFKNVQELDQYGITLIPSTWQVKRSQLEGKNRPRAVYYEPDYTAANADLKQIMPTNSRDFPGKVAQTCVQLIDRLGGGSDLFRGEAPGRTESGVALGLLYETANIPQIPTTTSIAEAYVQVYRRLLQDAKRLLGSSGSLALNSVDDAMAGVVLDPETGRMELGDQNPIPHPDEVATDIKAREPRMVEHRKQEVRELYRDQLVDPIAFYWLNYTEDLGFPVWRPDIVEQIRTCMYRNIIQWGDGETPGNLVPEVTDGDNHELQLRVLTAFMSRVEFALASVEVRTAFQTRRRFHESALGRYPDQLPYAEEEAGQDVTPFAGGTSPPAQLPAQLETAMANAGGGPGPQ